MLRSAPSSFGSLRVRPPFVARGQRIGLMGGSFDPPHEGHALVARIALRRLGLDRLWWIVTPGNPLKSGDGRAPQAERIAAARRLASDPRMQVTGFEAALGTPYTFVTLAFLKRRFPDARFVWVMGADNLAHFHRWQHWRELARMMPIAVVDRPGWRLAAHSAPMAQALARAYVPEAEARVLVRRRPPAWTFLTGPLSPLSSTGLRARQRQPERASVAPEQR